VWGTSSHTTAFRNWILGTTRVCTPNSGRGAVNCSGKNGRYGFQAARAVNISYLSSSNSFVGNVLGSAEMQALMSYNHPSTQVAAVEYPSTRSYDAAAYGWSFGYGKFSDSGSGTGCGAGAPPCHLAGTSSSSLLHGNFSNIDGSIAWTPGITHALPASLYLAAKPRWWGAIPFPATGPEIVGGTGPRGHSYGNPAEACFLHAMGGSAGGAGSPLPFNAESCYGK
jgi:hypothetical protein